MTRYSSVWCKYMGSFWCQSIIPKRLQIGELAQQASAAMRSLNIVSCSAGRIMFQSILRHNLLQQFLGSG